MLDRELGKPKDDNKKTDAQSDRQLCQVLAKAGVSFSGVSETWPWKT